MNKKSILVLTPRLPYPLIGGDRLRIFTICQELSREYNVILLSLVESKDELTMVLPNDGVFSNVTRVYLPKWRSYLNTILAVFSGESLQTAYYRSSEFNLKIKSMLPHIDLVFAHLIRSGVYIQDVKKPKILEMTDAISLNYLRLSKLARRYNFRGLIYSIERKRILKLELMLAHKFDHSFLVSGVDQAYLCEKDSNVLSRISVSPLGLDVDGLEFIPQLKDSFNIAFVGNMTTTQNLDAAEWFSSSILPILQAKNSKFCFHVIGNIDRAGKNRLSKYPGVKVTGRVESIRDSLLECFAAVCPMRFGAGVQTKVLEYMAYGIPTVSTSIGNEGIDASDGNSILIADTDIEMANQLERLQSDVELGKYITCSARSFVKDRYDSSIVSQPILKKIKKIIDQ